MKVSDLMNPEPPTVGEGATLTEVLKVMADSRHRHVVVVGEPEQVAGIVSDSDLAMFYDPVHMTPEKWQQTRVSQVMTREPVSIGGQAPIHEAAKLLLRTGVSALPVVDNGILRGVLSEKDFVRHFAKTGG